MLGGDGLLVVEPGDWSGEDLGRGPRTVARLLRDLPAVTVLLADPATVPERAGEVVEAFDICVSTSAEPPSPWAYVDMERIADAVRAHPLGAYSLVALTRVSAHLPAEAGIWAESATFSALMGSRPYLEWLATKPAPKERAEPDEPVLLDEYDGTLRITLNRPHVRNALDSRLRDALVAALEAAELASELSIELRGAGLCFSAGGDLTEFGTVPDPITAHAVRGTRHPALSLSRVADRVTAYVHGPSAGAGVELAAFAHRVVAKPDATFRLPEVAMGLVPGAGGTWSLVQRVGRQRGNWIMLTGELVDVQTALAWGLVDAVDSADES